VAIVSMASPAVLSSLNDSCCVLSPICCAPTGKQGWALIRLKQYIVPTHITLEHISPKIAPDSSTMPKVSAHTQAQTHNAITARTLAQQ
jgi:hypothetical protein